MADTFDVRPIEFENWQFAFDASKHPLSDCLNQHVRLADLRWVSNHADFLYSRSVFDFIDNASQTSVQIQAQANVDIVVDLDDLVCELVIRLFSEDRPASMSSHAAERALAETGLARPTRQGLEALATPRHFAAKHRPGGARGSSSAGLPSLPNGQGPSAALAPEIVETCALAAVLVAQPSVERARVTLDPFIATLLATAAKYVDRLTWSREALPEPDPEWFRRIVRDQLLPAIHEQSATASVDA